MRLRDPLVESALSLLTPFAAYLAADSLHVSGVLSRDEWDAAGGDPGPGTPVTG
jgi:hypothetical protein